MEDYKRSSKELFLYILYIYATILIYDIYILPLSISTSKVCILTYV